MKYGETKTFIKQFERFLEISGLMSQFWDLNMGILEENYFFNNLCTYSGFCTSK